MTEQRHASIYSIFARRLASAIPLPALGEPLALEDAPDVTFRVVDPQDGAAVPEGCTPRMTALAEDDRELAIYDLPHGFAVRWVGLLSLLFSDDGRTITCIPEQGATETYIQGSLLGIGIAFALHLQGVSSLHAGAVALPSGAIGLMAVPGTGKSTLTTLLARRRNQVLTDDILAIEERKDGFHALPSYPSIGLTAQSLEFLGGQEAAKRIRAGWDKVRIMIPKELDSFAAAPVKLKGLYTLSRTADDDAFHRPPRIERLPVHEAIQELLEQTNCLPLLPQHVHTRHFAFVCRLAAAVPVYRLSYASGLDRLKDVVDAVLQNETAIASASAVGA